MLGNLRTYGDWGFLSRFYPISFMGFLSVQAGSGGKFITSNYIFAGIGVMMPLGSVGRSGIQKRRYIYANRRST